MFIVRTVLEKRTCDRRLLLQLIWLSMWIATCENGHSCMVSMMEPGVRGLPGCSAGCPRWETASQVFCFAHKLSGVYRRTALTVCSAFRTVLVDAVFVISGLVPIDISEEERAIIYSIKSISPLMGKNPTNWRFQTISFEDFQLTTVYEGRELCWAGVLGSRRKDPTMKHMGVKDAFLHHELEE